MFRPGQLISLLEDVNYHIFLETLDNTRSIWTMGPPMSALSPGDTVMYVDSMEKTNDGSLDVKYIVLHDGKLWTTSGWFAKDKMPGHWKAKND